MDVEKFITQMLGIKKKYIGIDHVEIIDNAFHFDLEKKEIIEILPDRRVKTVEDYFRKCDTGNVQIVVMDMSRAVKHAVQRAFGNPMIIADHFHFMRQGYWHWIVYVVRYKII